MKYLHRSLLVLGMALLPAYMLSAQCEPDTANCKDTGEPGQLCPPNLPNAMLNEAYDEIITVIAPDTASVGEIQVGLAYVTVDAVENLPPGVNYLLNAEIFYPDSAYCIQIFGTPTEAGKFPLKITVSAYINVGAGVIVKGGEITDSTSVSLTVNWPSAIDPYQTSEFHVFPNSPNPFSEVTRIGFYTPFDDYVTLQVYNILGEMLHEEKQGASPGENFFEFNGGSLNPGSYFYRITNSSELFTGKFIKSK
jgi:hypothetical protein